jgi:hypothetical protein
MKITISNKQELTDAPQLFAQHRSEQQAERDHRDRILAAIARYENQSIKRINRREKRHLPVTGGTDGASYEPN